MDIELSVDFCSFQRGVCNDFKAGDKLRSVVGTKKLSVTGIFGSSCKHDIPIRFVNMKHGERLIANNFKQLCLICQSLLQTNKSKLLTCVQIFEYGMGSQGSKSKHLTFVLSQ